MGDIRRTLPPAGRQTTNPEVTASFGTAGAGQGAATPRASPPGPRSQLTAARSRATSPLAVPRLALGSANTTGSARLPANHGVGPHRLVLLASVSPRFPPMKGGRLLSHRLQPVFSPRRQRRDPERAAGGSPGQRRPPRPDPPRCLPARPAARLRERGLKAEAVSVSPSEQYSRAGL